MKLAVIGSRSLQIEHLEDYLPEGVTEIISGGAKGMDQCAKQYAQEHHIPYIEFLPQYEQYGKLAPLKRNDQMIDRADGVLVFWDGQSRGSEYVIQQCKKRNVPCDVHVMQEGYAVDMPRKQRRNST